VVQPSELTRLVSFVLLSPMMGHSCPLSVLPTSSGLGRWCGMYSGRAATFMPFLTPLGAQLAKPRSLLTRSAMRHRLFRD
jgi:hypothetical protein